MTTGSIRPKRMSIGIVAGLAAVLVAGLFTVAGANPSNGLPTSPNPYICDESKRGQSVSFNHGGYVYWGFHCGSADLVRDLDGNPIRSDAPEPGVLMEYTTSGGPVGVYRGETRRNIIAEAPPGPLVYRGVQRGTLLWESDDGNHRAVLGWDGKYYREERVRGQWVRSTEYKSFRTHQPELHALRSVIWNAYYLCQGGGLQSMYWWPNAANVPTDCS
ncbi:MAG: hypothetical protein F4066_04760 [Chloroflexi bacterium]|nr:hypothetical protein [Chloroflexota bacterium]MYI04155.1 hypothetical protein [Chloroflexota bacterium]